MTQRCRVCGCSNLSACEGGCAWVADDLCSACEPIDFRPLPLLPILRCLVHFEDEPCSTCRSYIAAGL